MTRLVNQLLEGLREKPTRFGYVLMAQSQIKAPRS